MTSRELCAPVTRGTERRRAVSGCRLAGLGVLALPPGNHVRRGGLPGLGTAPVAGFHRFRTCPPPTALVTGGFSVARLGWKSSYISFSQGGNVHPLRCSCGQAEDFSRPWQRLACFDRANKGEVTHAAVDLQLLKN